MAKTKSSPILRLIQQAAAAGQTARLSDYDLLHRFAAQRDEDAFRLLLLRHGPMVLEVCRGILGSEADVEDAFQAAFLILASKARTLSKATSVGGWLHGVAYRTALKARARLATRRQYERCAPQRPGAEPDDLTWREVRQVLHEELNGLAEQYRGPLVACYLEARTQDEAAAHLGIGTTTLKKRLERARALLRTRLVRRGLGPVAVLVSVTGPLSADSAWLPVRLASDTVRAACLSASGQPLPPGLISLRVAELTKGAAPTMWSTKLTLAATVLSVAGLFTGVCAFSQTVDPAPSVAGQDHPDQNGRAASAPTQPAAPRELPDRTLVRAGAPVPKPKVGDDDPSTKWPTDPPRILEHDPYLLVPHYDGKILSVGCVAKEHN
jgi:RNA polymerase sigma factor (sigma-70 family)